MGRREKMEEENFSIHMDFRSSSVEKKNFPFSFFFPLKQKQTKKNINKRGPHDHEALVVGANNGGKKITDIENQKIKAKI